MLLAAISAARGKRRPALLRSFHRRLPCRRAAQQLLDRRDYLLPQRRRIADMDIAHHTLLIDIKTGDPPRLYFRQALGLERGVQRAILSATKRASSGSLSVFMPNTSTGRPAKSGHQFLHLRHGADTPTAAAIPEVEHHDLAAASLDRPAFGRQDRWSPRRRWLAKHGARRLASAQRTWPSPHAQTARDRVGPE